MAASSRAQYSAMMAQSSTESPPFAPLPYKSTSGGKCDSFRRVFLKGLYHTPRQGSKTKKERGKSPSLFSVYYGYWTSTVQPNSSFTLPVWMPVTVS